MKNKNSLTQIEILTIFGSIGVAITYFDTSQIFSHAYIANNLTRAFFKTNEWIAFVNTSSFVILGFSTTITSKIYLSFSEKYSFRPPKWIRHIGLLLTKLERFVSQIRNNTSDWSFHVIFWIYIAFIIDDYETLRNYTEKTIAFVFSIILFYFTMILRLNRDDLLRRKVFKAGKNKYENIYAFLILFFITYYVIEIAFFQTLFLHDLHENNINEALIFNFGLFCGGILAAISERSNRLDKQRIFEAAEKERITNELNISLTHRMDLLNSQIGSHFFFNCLNFVRRKSDIYSPDLSKSIVLLSKVIRNALESTKPSRKEGQRKRVPLDDEITYLRDFVEFYQLISEEPVHVNFETYGQTSYMSITPLLLVTFVENAFKYGDLTKKDDPLQMQLVVVKGELTFTVKNRKRRSGPPEPTSTRIGLHNVETRLRYEYSDNYKLNISDMNENFIVNLQLTL